MIAQKFHRTFEAQERDETGMYFLSPIQFLQAGHFKTSLKDVEDEQPDSRSYDATEIWVFSDGSRLRVGNPRQAAFAANLDVL